MGAPGELLPWRLRQGRSGGGGGSSKLAPVPAPTADFNILWRGRTVLSLLSALWAVSCRAFQPTGHGCCANLPALPQKLPGPPAPPASPTHTPSLLHTPLPLLPPSAHRCSSPSCCALAAFGAPILSSFPRGSPHGLAPGGCAASTSPWPWAYCTPCAHVPPCSCSPRRSGGALGAPLLLRGLHVG